MNTRMNKVFGGFAATAAVLALTACLLPTGNGDGLTKSGDVPPPVESLESIQALLASSSCNNCHGAGATAGLNISNFDRAFESFFVISGGDTIPKAASTTAVGTGLNRIQPGNPEASALYRRITATNSAKMPPFGGPLDPAIVERIRQWILDSALIRDTTNYDL
jgi:hypothetical protein